MSAVPRIAAGCWSRHALEDVGVGRTRLDQRAADRLDELSQLETSRSVLGNLARATGHDVLMTFAAGLRIERGTEAVRDALDLLEYEPIVVEGTQRYDAVFVDGVELGPLDVEPVGAIVERRRGFAEYRIRRGDGPGRPGRRGIRGRVRLPVQRAL
jgi:hypothetical protein